MKTNMTPTAHSMEVIHRSTLEFNTIEDLKKDFSKFNFEVGDIVKIRSNGKVEYRELSETIDLDSIIWEKAPGVTMYWNLVEFSSRKYTFGTIEEMKKAKYLKEGDVIELLGFYTAGDGAGHKRKICAADDGSGEVLDNDKWACIVHNGEVNVSWFGVFPDTGTSVSNQIQRIFDDIKINKVTMPKGQYNMSNVHIKGRGYGSTPLCIDTQGGIYIEPDKDTYDYILGIGGVDRAMNLKYSSDKSQILSESFIKLNLGNLIIRKPKEAKISTIVIRALVDSEIGSIMFHHGGGTQFDSIQMTISESWENVFGALRFYTKQTLCPALYFKKKEYSNTDASISSSLFTYIGLECDYGDGAVFVIDGNCPLLDTKIQNIDIESRYGDTLTDTSIMDIMNFDNSLPIIKFNGGMQYGVGINSITTNNINRRYNSVNKRFKCLFGIDGGFMKATSNSVKIGDIITDLYDKFSLFNFGNLNDWYSFISIRTSDIGTTKVTEHLPICTSFYNPLRFIFLGLDVTEFKFKHSGRLCINELDDKTVLSTRNNDKGWIHIPEVLGSKLHGTYKLTVTYNCNNPFYFRAIIGESQFQGSLIQSGQGTIDIDVILDHANLGFRVDFTYINTSCELSNLKISKVSSIQQLDTPYYATKMREEGVYSDFVSYMDEKHAFDAQQREVQAQQEAAYQEALASNPELSFEDFLSQQPAVMTVIPEPLPSEALLAFKTKYLG